MWRYLFFIDLEGHSDEQTGEGLSSKTATQDGLPQGSGVLPRGGGETMICISIVPETNEEALCLLARALPEADLVELRIDRIGEPDLPLLLHAGKERILVTNRRRDEGGFFASCERQAHGAASRGGRSGCTLRGHRGANGCCGRGQTGQGDPREERQNGAHRLASRSQGNAFPADPDEKAQGLPASRGRHREDRHPGGTRRRTTSGCWSSSRRPWGWARTSLRSAWAGRGA